MKVDVASLFSTTSFYNVVLEKDEGGKVFATVAMDYDANSDSYEISNVECEEGFIIKNDDLDIDQIIKLSKGG